NQDVLSCPTYFFPVMGNSCFGGIFHNCKGYRALFPIFFPALQLQNPEFSPKRFCKYIPNVPANVAASLCPILVLFPRLILKGIRQFFHRSFPRKFPVFSEPLSKLLPRQPAHPRRQKPPQTISRCRSAILFRFGRALFFLCT